MVTSLLDHYNFVHACTVGPHINYCQQSMKLRQSICYYISYSYVKITNYQSNYNSKALQLICKIKMCLSERKILRVRALRKNKSYHTNNYMMDLFNVVDNKNMHHLMYIVITFQSIHNHIKFNCKPIKCGANKPAGRQLHK